MHPASHDWPRLDPDPGELLAALEQHFGHTSFQGPQLEAIRAVLGGQDLLLTVPTGSGKSLCYQLPALLLEGLTLVVSPLIALAEDQVAGLRRRGLPASFINSSLSGSERRRRLEAALRGELRLLYVTPERFRSPSFLERLPELRVTRLAVDEAHCISEWGHDFRPDYWRLGDYRRLLGDPPTSALTATATPRTAGDIVEQLRLEAPLHLQDRVDRENLVLASTTADTEEQKLDLLLDRIARIDGPGIVYSTLIRDLERLHVELKRRGVPTLVYHGKLSPQERREMQARFMASEREVVLATNAFGMGVDKPDIRFVLHAQVPRTIEALTQELGRAGRDGRPAWCETFAFAEDLAVQQNFIGWANPDAEYFHGVLQTLAAWGPRIATKDLDDLRAELLVKNRSDNRVSICLAWARTLGLLEGSFERHDLRLVRTPEPDELPEFLGSAEKHRRDLASLLEVWRFVSDPGDCRRAVLSRHFKQAAGAVPCGGCDVCVPADTLLAQSCSPRPASVPSETAAQREAAVDDAAPEGATPDAKALYKRGDWIRIDGRHLGQIVRVDGQGSRTRFTVLSAGDLRERKVDPRRSEIELLEEGGGSV